MLDIRKIPLWEQFSSSPHPCRDVALGDTGQGWARLDSIPEDFSNLRDSMERPWKRDETPQVLWNGTGKAWKRP